MIMKVKYVITNIACLLMLLTACKVKPVDNVDLKEVNAEIQSRKIKKISDAQVSGEALKKGEQIVAFYISNMQNQDFPCGAEEITSLPDSLQGVEVAKNVVCNTPSDKSSVEYKLFEAYKYNQSQGLDLRPNLQADTDTTYLYSYPVSKDGNLKVLNVQMSRKAIVLGL